MEEKREKGEREGKREDGKKESLTAEVVRLCEECVAKKME